jgi:hypothetical protein
MPRQQHLDQVQGHLADALLTLADVMEGFEPDDAAVLIEVAKLLMDAQQRVSTLLRQQRGANPS